MRQTKTLQHILLCGTKNKCCVFQDTWLTLCSEWVAKWLTYWFKLAIESSYKSTLKYLISWWLILGISGPIFLFSSVLYLFRQHDASNKKYFSSLKWSKSTFRFWYQSSQQEPFPRAATTKLAVKHHMFSYLVFPFQFSTSCLHVTSPAFVSTCVSFGRICSCFPHAQGPVSQSKFNSVLLSLGCLLHWANIAHAVWPVSWS